MRRDLVAFIALGFSLVFPSAGLPQSATSALISKSSRIDLKTLMAKATSGNPEAQYQLGIAYYHGLGVDKSEYEATRWYRLAANSGHTDAQNNLPYLYETGPVGLKDLSEAIKWYNRYPGPRVLSPERL
jgi:TPR repeat protein